MKFYSDFLKESCQTKRHSWKLTLAPACVYWQWHKPARHPWPNHLLETSIDEDTWKQPSNSAYKEIEMKNDYKLPLNPELVTDLRNWFFVIYVPLEHLIRTRLGGVQTVLIIMFLPAYKITYHLKWSEVKGTFNTQIPIYSMLVFSSFGFAPVKMWTR